MLTKYKPNLKNGLRGNQPGTLVVDNVTIPTERPIGTTGEGAITNNEIINP